MEEIRNVYVCERWCRWVFKKKEIWRKIGEEEHGTRLTAIRGEGRGGNDGKKGKGLIKEHV